MDRPSVCSSCLSKYEEIHGMIYAGGSPIGTRCENTWHRGPNYNPDKLQLTPEDKEMFRQIGIGF